MEALLWLLLPLFTAAGSALLAFYIMEARMEVAIAKEREALVEAQTHLQGQQKLMEEKVRSAEYEARRKSMDEFLSEFRVEERHYMRESKSLFANRKSLVLQERLYFRNIPLSNWVEHELPVNESTDLPSLARSASVFTTRTLSEGQPAKPNQLLSST
jgi:hypothetical protein